MKKQSFTSCLLCFALVAYSQSYDGMAKITFEPQDREPIFLEMPLTAVNYDAATAGFTFEKDGYLLQFSFTDDLDFLPLAFYLEYGGKPYATEVANDGQSLLAKEEGNTIGLVFVENVSVAGLTMSTPVAIKILPGSSLYVKRLP
jgi:hypothetical protein